MVGKTDLLSKDKNNMWNKITCLALWKFNMKETKENTILYKKEKLP